MAKKDAAPEEAPAEQPVSDDPKEQFRRALEAKKHKGGHSGTGPSGGGGGSKGSSAAAGGRREFRRKSG